MLLQLRSKYPHLLPFVHFVAFSSKTVRTSTSLPFHTLLYAKKIINDDRAKANQEGRPYLYKYVYFTEGDLVLRIHEPWESYSYALASLVSKTIYNVSTGVTSVVDTLIVSSGCY